jgi:hypothetical protein
MTLRLFVWRIWPIKGCYYNPFRSESVSALFYFHSDAHQISLTNLIFFTLMVKSARFITLESGFGQKIKPTPRSIISD